MIIKRRPGSRPPRRLVKATQVGIFIQAPSSLFPRAREPLPGSEEGIAVLGWVSCGGLGKHAGALLWTFWGLL